jgi:hypothetical protein
VDSIRRILGALSLVAALTAAPGAIDPALAQVMAALVPPPGLQPFADLQPAFPERERTGYTLKYEAQPGPVGPLGGAATLAGSVGPAKFDEGVFYDATLRFRECAPDAPYCVDFGVGNAPTSQLFRDLDVAGSRAFATHIVCCNGHYWTLTWYDARAGMTYRMDFERNIADRYGLGISPENVAGARALAEVAGQLAPLR